MGILIEIVVMENVSKQQNNNSITKAISSKIIFSSTYYNMWGTSTKIKHSKKFKKKKSIRDK